MTKSKRKLGKSNSSPQDTTTKTIHEKMKYTKVSHENISSSHTKFPGPRANLKTFRVPPIDVILHPKIVQFLTIGLSYFSLQISKQGTLKLMDAYLKYLGNENC